MTESVKPTNIEKSYKNPFTLSRTDRSRYFTRYMQLMYEPGIQIVDGKEQKHKNVYRGGQLWRFLVAGDLGIGTAVVDDGGLKYVLTPQGWKNGDNLNGEVMDIVSDFETLGTFWTLAPHSIAFDPQNPPSQ
jgi:hypothetical protein